jgi:hypothetical protein
MSDVLHPVGALAPSLDELGRPCLAGDLYGRRIELHRDSDRLLVFEVVAGAQVDERAGACSPVAPVTAAPWGVDRGGSSMLRSELGALLDALDRIQAAQGRVTAQVDLVRTRIAAEIARTPEEDLEPRFVPKKAAAIDLRTSERSVDRWAEEHGFRRKVGGRVFIDVVGLASVMEADTRRARSRTTSRRAELPTVAPSLPRDMPTP